MAGLASQAASVIVGYDHALQKFPQLEAELSEPVHGLSLAETSVDATADAEFLDKIREWFANRRKDKTKEKVKDKINEIKKKAKEKKDQILGKAKDKGKEKAKEKGKDIAVKIA